MICRYEQMSIKPLQTRSYLQKLRRWIQMRMLERIQRTIMQYWLESWCAVPGERNHGT